MSTFWEWTVAHRAQIGPLVLGLLAIYLLLPPPQRFLRRIGLLLGLLALVGLGLSVSQPGFTLHAFLFYVFSGMAIVAAGATVTNHNPIYSALAFALVTLNVCGLFLLRGAFFLAAATVIIYAGAIVVTFLFIMMLAQQSGNSPYDRRAHEPLLASLASFVLLGGLLVTLDTWARQRESLPPDPVRVGRIAQTPASDAGPRSAAGFLPLAAPPSVHANSQVLPNESSRLRGQGRTLFSDYLVTVELAGTLLLVAGVGAVAIASRRIVRNA